MKEANRPLELLALEPEKNRLIFQLTHNSNLKEFKKRLMFCSKNPIKNQNLIVTSVSVIKKKRKESSKIKRITLFLSTRYPRFVLTTFFIILISTLPSPSAFSLELYFKLKYFSGFLLMPLFFYLIRNRIKTSPI